MKALLALIKKPSTWVIFVLGCIAVLVIKPLFNLVSPIASPIRDAVEKVTPSTGA